MKNVTRFFLHISTECDGIQNTRIFNHFWSPELTALAKVQPRRRVG